MIDEFTTDRPTEAVLMYLNANRQIDEAGNVTFHDPVHGPLLAGAGENFRPMTVREVAYWTTAFKPELWGEPKPAETKSAAPAAAAFDGPNPFAPATVNWTEQMIIEKRDPQLAARLRAEAGKAPIHTHTAPAVTETKPTSDGPNPFASGTVNYTQQMLMMKRDPALAARLAAEAKMMGVR